MKYGVFFTNDPDEKAEPKQAIDKLLKPGRDFFNRMICNIVGENYTERQYLYESVALRAVYEQYALLAAENYYKR